MYAHNTSNDIDANERSDSFASVTAGIVAAAAVVVTYDRIRLQFNYFLHLYVV